MSDVGIAPAPSSAPSAPSAPPPSSGHEVPVNPNPVTVPNPISSTPPSERPEGRREAIQKAFDKARENIRPRDAKMGDNNPPEEMKPERRQSPPKARSEQPPPIDLKKRPNEQPQQAQPQQQPRERAEHGHFAPRQAQTAAKAGQARQVPQLPKHAPYRDPLPRMDAAAKATWAATPEPVRGAVHRMHQDYSRAYQQYRGDHEEMTKVRPFADLAKKQGTTLQRALTNYVNMETKLRNDVVGGLDLIINNLNLRADDGTPNGRQLTLQDVCWHIVNQTPEQRQLLQSRNSQMAQTHQLQAAQARIAALENVAKKYQYDHAFNQTRRGVDQYAATHPRLDELGDLIAHEIKLGFDLDTAYRRAELLKPATHAAQTRTQTAQTRTSDRSISGAPSGSPSNGAGRPRAPVSRRDAITNAIKRVNGSF